MVMLLRFALMMVAAGFFVPACGVDPTPQFRLSELQEWDRQVTEEVYNNLHEKFIEDYGVAELSPIVAWITPRADRELITIIVNCEKNLAGIEAAIRQRLAALSIPQEAVVVQSGGRPGLDAYEYQRLEECLQHPAGFGGYYLSNDNRTANVYLLHPSIIAAEEVLTFQLDTYPRLKNQIEEVHPLQGQFTYLQLFEWSSRLRKSVDPERPALTDKRQSASDIGRRCLDEPVINKVWPNHYLNRVQVEINWYADENTVRQALEERLAALDIPLEATVIEVEPAREPSPER